MKKLLVREIINRWDPLGLLCYTSENQYAFEINEITKALEKENDSKRLGRRIYLAFCRGFGAHIFNRNTNECEKIARKLLFIKFREKNKLTLGPARY
ncbi:MAG: YugE family protein [Cytophagaceae bacterium]|nr:YugE family protein [Cytophagaceae bacterium]